MWTRFFRYIIAMYCTSPDFLGWIILLVQVVDVATNQHVGIARIIEDPERQFLVLVSDVADVFDVGRQYQLSIQFMSFLKDDLRGFYRTSFVQNGQTK